MADDLAKARAKTQAMRVLQAEDGRKAMAEYEANIVATREKTERLRALRLAHEATAAKAPPVSIAKSSIAKPKGVTKSKTRTVAKKPARVAARLDEQRDTGT